MQFDVLTLFPEMFNILNESIIGRAKEKGLINVNLINIRDFSKNKHKKVDDTPYGGGAGMVIQPDVVYDAYKSVISNIKDVMNVTNSKKIENTENVEKLTRTRVIYMSPQGKKLDQQKVEELSKQEHLILLCGHYEGIDERVLEEIVTDYVSIGDYVLTGGELPAMVMMDSISRMVPGVLNNQESGETESFSGNLLEYPQYSRPEEWHGKKVPEVLLSGHHANVDKWRREQSIIRTAKWRPDLLPKADLTNKEWDEVRRLRKQWKEEVEK